MAPTLNETGTRILHRAQRLLQERGYQFQSFQDLADAVKIRKASVHHYFKNKEDLALAMVKDYRGKLQAWMTELETRNLDAPAKLRAYFEMFDGISKGGKFICPGGSLLIEWFSFSKSVRDPVTELIGVHREWLLAVLSEGVKSKKFRVLAEDIPAHATLIGSSLQGGLQIARATNDPEAFLKRLFSQLEKLTFAKEVL